MYSGGDMFRRNLIIICIALYFVIFAAIAQAQLPQIQSGLNYLTSSPKPDGTWATSTTQVETTAATASALESLKILNQTTGSSYTNASAWLQSQSPNTVDFLSQRIRALKLTDSSIDALIPLLNQLKHAWGGDDGYVTNNIDTARALHALKAANYSDQSLIFSAINYLLTIQNSDGGWGFRLADDSNVEDSALVLSALSQYKTTYLMDQQISAAATYLLSKQNNQNNNQYGGFGSNGSTVYETALAFIALIESGQTQGLPLQNAINYLTTTQLPNGSWNDDPYSTALALRALSYVKPDLAISTSDIAVTPSVPTVGESITITATFSNIGLEAATNVTVRLLDNGATVGDQTIAAIAPSGTGQATFAIAPLTPVGEHILTITVDPLNTIEENSRTNNSATSRIWAKALADLVVQPEYLTISPAYPKPTDSITLTFQIANMGESTASNVAADLYDGDPANGGVKLGSAVVSSITAGGLGSGTITFTLATVGSHTLYLIADPLHAITETSVTNNSAQKVVTVNATGGSGFIDLTIPMSSLRITPQRPHTGDTVAVSILAVNLGTEVASADVELFDGNPVGGTQLNKTTVTLNAGESRTLTVPWQIPSGMHTLNAYIDRANAVIERDETNNSQTLTVMADMVDIEVSASDISITPEHPMDGDPATVTAIIQNRGIANTGAFNVNLYNGDPDSGGTLLQTFDITNLAGDSTQTISYPFTAAKGTYRFYVVCDPDNKVAEFSEDNNLAIRSLLVKTSAEAKGPDLVPLEFDVSGTTTDPQSLRISGTAKVKFQNKGDDKVTTPFRITVFEDKDNDGIYTEGTDLALGSWDYATPMNPNMVGEVTINLAGTVTFRDAPIYAMLDSGQVVFEQNKNNNSIRKGSACENRPANPIEPVLKWQWRSGYLGVTSTPISPPVVIGLTDDNGDGKIDEKDTPSVLLITPGYYMGKLVALNGKTGNGLFSISDPAHDFSSRTLIAAGDINNDGKPEILIEGNNWGMMSYSNDGHLLWDNSVVASHWPQSLELNSNYAPKIADLDGSDNPVIVSGTTVVNGDGSIRLASQYKGRGNTIGFLGASAVADLDMDGKQEIVTGSAAYNSDGSVKWYNPAMPDGAAVIANFDDDPYPEIVVDSIYSSLYLLDHTGAIKWGPVYLSERGGLPTIADFDGDGQLEIGIKEDSSYVIFDKNGRIKRSLPIPRMDIDIWRVAATVFDLNGDGHPEIILYSDQYLRIFDGKTGTILYEEQAGKTTYQGNHNDVNRYQGVIVADVDGDGHAELVVTGRSEGYQWLRVYGAKDNDWQNTRRIWNQAGYHVTNVNDDGTIPRYETPSWLANNSYHCNVATSPISNPYLASDLSASFVRADMANYPASITITARIGNGGAISVPAGVRTTFYDGDPATGGILIGSAFTTKTLTLGDYEDVTLLWNTPGEGNRTILVTTDTDNIHSECDKINNSVTLPVYIASGKPDLSIVADDIVAPATIPEGSLTDILVTVRNIGTLHADNVLVRLYAGKPTSGGKQIGNDQIVSIIAAGSSVTIKATWNTLGVAGVSYLYVLVDPVATTIDANRGNNTANRQIVVTPAVKPDLQLGAEDITITPASAQEGDMLNIIATIHNRGSQTGSIKVALYDGIPTSGGMKRGETTIPQIVSQGGSATATFALDTIGLNGSHSLYVRIDPDNSIDESDETNNQASRGVTIAATGLTATIATDKSTYSANENVLTTVSLAELNGTARSLNYDLLILDANNVQAASLPDTAMTLGANATQNLTIPWNIATTYAGSYTVMLRIKENSRIVAKASAAIIITPVKTADAKIVVDKTAYRANEQAAISAVITGTSPNYIFTDLSAKTSVLDSTGQNLFTATRTIPTLANGQRIEIKNYWNTGTHTPGTYPAIIEITDATGTVLATATSNIVISSVVTPSTALQGTLSVDKQSFLAGETVNVTCHLINKGNVDLADVALSILTVHVVNQNVYNTLAYQAALPMGTSYSAAGQIDTTTFSAKDYLVILRANIGGVEESIASSYFRVEGAPSAPALSAPENGADVETFTPTLTVSNAADPNDDKLTYEFEIYSDNSLTQLVISGTTPETTGSTSWIAPTPLMENNTYFWRVRAYDGRLYGLWMAPASFRVNTVNDPPTAPTVASPAEGTTVASLAPMLTVTNATDLDSTDLTYNFDVALDPDFTQIVASTIGIAGGQGTTPWTVPVNLQENGWYYWRAQADDWLMEGAWSATARFLVNTANDAPTAPVVTSPVNSATVTVLATDVVVTNSSDPDSSSLLYYFEADTLPTFDSTAIIRSGGVAEGSVSTLWQLNGLADNTRYYLRVKSSDGSADSPWSAATEFIANTANDSPTTPTLANPSNGAGVNMFTPILSVHNSTDLDKEILTYEFEIYTDAALTELVAQSGAIAETASTTGWTVPVSLEENRTYFWRARAGDGSLQSGWMPTASFMVNTANDAPGAPQLSSPAESTTLSTLSPVLEVVNALDPDSAGLTYDFEVYSNNLLVTSISGVSEGTSGKTAATLSSALADNTLYSWRARAFDGDRYGQWMNMATFTTHIMQTAIKAEIEFEPETLNRKDEGRWVKVEIELPHGFSASDIDISSIRLEGMVAAEFSPHEVHGRSHDDCNHDRSRHDHSELTVKFKRSTVIAILPEGKHVPVHVTGKVGGVVFEGVAIIRVIK